jgi:uncharacterized protein YjiS (DUF1127 family)
MTMFSNIPRYPPATAATARGIDGFLSRCGRPINRLAAATIARHDRGAALVALHQLGDRELKDIGIYRCQIEHGLDEAAQTRARLQGFDRC